MVRFNAIKKILIQITSQTLIKPSTYPLKCHGRWAGGYNVKSNLSEVFCRKGIFKNFPKFTGKYFSQILFFNKVAGLRPTTLL